ncbi:hypothetical protein BO94DRAFT_546128 [Aspergillus sclerotioniger CBS 115572]|uniref:Uncharacterized protein n=1 Tax=Aspergillus sclerotioniger CBS 115572 TaxID=1450535 RepID=A0A317WRN8_9EURO|nr:hypothetical protein BO94DRAFT_546128 [Aspergillus sclerotioniger CBS 115572]PWY87972.1 hypothetical protein BO94DRAFT_546128 [Aspergillus sclerotioniger CBS 115572]
MKSCCHQTGHLARDCDDISLTKALIAWHVALLSLTVDEHLTLVLKNRIDYLEGMLEPVITLLTRNGPLVGLSHTTCPEEYDLAIIPSGPRSNIPYSTLQARSRAEAIPNQRAYGKPSIWHFATLMCPIHLPRGSRVFAVIRDTSSLPASAIWNCRVGALMAGTRAIGFQFIREREAATAAHRPPAPATAGGERKKKKAEKEKEKEKKEKKEEKKEDKKDPKGPQEANPV